MLCYLLFYQHYVFALDGVTIVNEDTIDMEYDYDVYRKHLFQPTSYLNAGYGVLYEHIGTVHQSIHTHYLIVGMKIPTHGDMPDGTKPCVFNKNTFHLHAWRDGAKKQCHFFNSLAHQVGKQAKHWSTRIFQMLHSDIPTMLPNQEIPFLSKEFHSVSDVDLGQKCTKRHVTPVINSIEKHRLETYKRKYKKE